jgi:hypothetical protein
MRGRFSSSMITIRDCRRRCQRRHFGINGSSTGSCSIAGLRRMHRYDRRVHLSLSRLNRRWSSCGRFKITIFIKLSWFIGVPYGGMRKRAAPGLHAETILGLPNRRRGMYS